MVLTAVPRNDREERDANGSEIHVSISKEGAHLLSPAFTFQTASRHSELPIFTILYNKYSDESCENWQGPSDSPRWHMLLLNKVPLDKDPGGAQMQGQWVSWGSPGLAHTWGSEEVLGGPSQGGRRTSFASPSGLEVLSH